MIHSVTSSFFAIKILKEAKKKISRQKQFLAGIQSKTISWIKTLKFHMKVNQEKWKAEREFFRHWIPPKKSFCSISSLSSSFAAKSAASLILAVFENPFAKTLSLQSLWRHMLIFSFKNQEIPWISSISFYPFFWLQSDIQECIYWTKKILPTNNIKSLGNFLDFSGEIP